MTGLEAINEAVNARVGTVEARNIVLARAIDQVSLDRIKFINRIVGRAGQSIASIQNNEVLPDIPDYQKHLAQYVWLKRKLGLYRRSLVSEHISDEGLLLIGQKMKTLEQGVREAREEARKLRFGYYSARTLPNSLHRLGLHGHLW